MNGDGFVDEMDADYITNYVAGPEPEASNPPDVLTGDVVCEAGCRVVDMMDALYLSKCTRGKVGEP